MDIMDKQKYIFGKLFLLSNKLRVIGDRVLSEEMTILQWLMTVSIAQFGNTSPTLGEVAELMGSSHQNVKQLAEKLHKKGFLDIKKDWRDLRATRLTLTEKSFSYWERCQEEVRRFLSELFEDFTKDDIDMLYECLSKLYESILKMENNYERVL